MKVSRSGFYRYLGTVDQVPPEDKRELHDIVKKLFVGSHESYGSRRLSKALRLLGFDIGRYKARSLMRELGLQVRFKRRFKVTTNSKHPFPVAANVLDRQFTVSQPNSVWGADISYLWTEEGWLYLAVVIDLFSRKVVGWSMADHMRTSLVIDALTMAVWRRRPDKGLVHHSDRGSQYASYAYQAVLDKQGMICSMSGKGDCYDNAVVERFFRSLKSERTHYKRYLTREDARRDVIDYIEMFYNSQRLHSYLGYMSPNEFEQQAMEKAA